MSLVTTSLPSDAELVSAFEVNEFDIAGLADFSLDDSKQERAIKELYRILSSGTEPRGTNRDRLARVLLAMILVARDDYAGSGHQEYWPFLFDRIEQTVAGTVNTHRLTSLRSQSHQSLLGRWFRLALDEFGYTVPDEGQTYVGPVVFHAGIPRTSLRGAMELIDAAVQQYGPQAVTLPHDLRSRLAQNHFPPLHVNVERLLASRLQGASQLWSCLARVVLAWHRDGEISDELRQLPAALDPEDVRRALPGKSSIETPRRDRVQLPQIRFDIASGEVYVTIPSGSSTEWRLTASGRDVDVCWVHTPLGLNAELLSPLPVEIKIAERGGDGRISRTILTQPTHWPGIWFHASNGNIEDGATIEANGLEPGRWIVLFEGTPTRWNVASKYRVPLKWSYFAGHEAWTAWEIDVPPRSDTITSLEWCVDENRFHVQLARRPGARIETCMEPLAMARTESGESVSVFADAPTIRLCRDRSLAVLLLRDSKGQIETLGMYELPPDKDWRIPISEKGIYQFREARGVGRTLLHFAVIPGLRVSGPVYDSAKTRVAIELTDTAASGNVLTSDGEAISARNCTYRCEQSTVEPQIGLKWKWCDNASSPLWFQWRIEGLRWRVVRLGEDLARWTRESIFLSPNDVRKHDAQLEIQFPAKSELRVNEVTYTQKLTRESSVNGLMLSLLPFGELVHVSVDFEEPRPAIVLSDRPVVDRIEAITVDDSVLIRWDSKTPASVNTIVAWNGLEPLAEVVRFTLTDENIRDRAVAISCSQLPGCKWRSLALGRSVRVGMTRQVLHLAAEKSATNTPASILLNCETGNSTAPKADAPDDWIAFLHTLSFDRINRTSRSGCQIVGALSYLVAMGEFEFDQLFALESKLSAEKVGGVPSLSTSDEDWCQNVRQSLTKFVHDAATANPSQLLHSGHVDRSLLRLLRMGIAIGQSCPFRWLSEQTRPDGSVCAYPFLFIRDLWLLGTRETVGSQQNGANSTQHGMVSRDRQKVAATQVWSFLESLKFQSVVRLLPIAQKMAWSQDTTCPHIHSVALPPRDIKNASDFTDALGLDEIALDCHATCDDPFWSDAPARAKGTWQSPETRRVLNHQRQPSAKYDYSLLWSDDEQKWYFERPQVEPTTCGETSSPLIVRALRPENLIEELKLRDQLKTWAELDTSRDSIVWPPQLSEQLINQLCADPITGRLHRDLITAPQTETRELLGTTVVVVAKTALIERARIAWQISWVERLSAWNGPKHFFSNDLPTQGHHADFLRALGDACDKWPRLMERCLALVELMIWSVYRGGLGIAFRFDTDNPSYGHDSAPTTPPLGTARTRPLAHFMNSPSPRLRDQ